MARRLGVTVRYLLGAAMALTVGAACAAPGRPNLFGLGESAEGIYQLDTTTISKSGATASAWVTIIPSERSEGRRLGSSFMLVLYFLGCDSKKVHPLAWKALDASGAIFAEGVHGKERERRASKGSMDERILSVVCTWDGSRAPPNILRQ